MEQKISKKIDDYYFGRNIDRQSSEADQHYHNYYVIYYMQEGGCRYFIDDCSFEAKAGDLIFIPKGIIYRTNYITSSHSRLLINFTEDYIPEDVFQYLAKSKYLYR
jgi:quercetin dioxygenase-like cupin family protein